VKCYLGLLNKNHKRNNSILNKNNFQYQTQLHKKMATILEHNNESNAGAQRCAKSSRNAKTMAMRTFSEVGGLLFVGEHQHRLASKREAKLHRQMQKACELGLPQVAKHALKQGINPLNRTTVNTDGWVTYMHIAVQFGSLKVLKLLVAAGVSVDTLTSAEHTPLMFAAAFQHTRAVQFLIRKGADVNHNNTGCLAIACSGLNPFSGEQGCPSLVLVKILLDAGADAYAKCRGRSIKEMAERCRIPAYENAFDMAIAMLDAAMQFKIKGCVINKAELECSICLDSDNTKLCQLPCCYSASFCIGCIKRWHTTNPSCPLCRAPIRNARRIVNNLAWNPNNISKKTNVKRGLIFEYLDLKFK